MKISTVNNHNKKVRGRNHPFRRALLSEIHFAYLRAGVPEKEQRDLSTY
jgi:hypothetical protein